MGKGFEQVGGEKQKSGENCEAEIEKKGKVSQVLIANYLAKICEAFF